MQGLTTPGISASGVALFKGEQAVDKAYRAQDAAIANPDPPAFSSVAQVDYRSPAMAGNRHARRCPPTLRADEPETTLEPVLVHGTSPTRGVVKRPCDDIEDNLTAQFSPAARERERDLMAGAILLGFQQHFASTPSEWILNRRLDAARQMLLDGSGDIRIAEVAFRC